MAKRYITYKQFLKKDSEKRSECLKFWSEERLQNLTVNLVSELEETLRSKTELNKQNIISIIDFSGAYLYLHFCNQNTTGPAFLNATRETLNSLDIPYEESHNDQCSIFIEYDTFLLNFKA